MASSLTRAVQNMQVKKKLNRTKTQELVATAQDIKFARLLAGNDKTASDRAVRSLRKWLEQRCKSRIPLTEADLMVIWQGLFYSMWMSDKPLVQEECAERIASLIHCLDVKSGILFFQTGMKTLGNQWYGIDQWRYDKFLMFIRRFLRQALVFLKNKSWNIILIKEFAAVLEQTVLSAKSPPPLSLVLHFCDIFNPELAKISEGQLNPNILNEFLKPFVTLLAASNDQRMMNAIADNVFRYLMKQSNTGQDYEEKFQVWKKLGFPGGNINSLQKANSEDDDDEEEENDGSDEDDEYSDAEENQDEDDTIDIIEETDEEELTALDPRAGRVNVILPQLLFSCKNLISLLLKYKFEAKNTRARSVFKKLIQEFTDLSTGDYPLGMKKVDLYKDDGSTRIKKSANKLIKFENQLYGRNKPNDRKRKVVEANDEQDEGDQEVPTMKKPKLEKFAKEKKGKGKENQKTKQEPKSGRELKPKSNSLEEKQKQKKLTEKKVMKLLEEKQNILRNVLEERQKLNSLKEDKSKKSKLKATATKEAQDEKLEQQIRKALKTSKSLELQKKELFKKNLKLKSKKKQLESEVIQTKTNQFQKTDKTDCFVRNSGTWIVYDPESESESDIERKASQNSKPESPKSLKKLPKSPQKKESITTPLKKIISPPKTNITNGNISTTSSNSLKSISSSSLTLHTSTPQKSPETISSGKTSPKTSNQLFPANDWDVDLKDGEVEFFVPSKKFLAKGRKSMGVPTTQDNVLSSSFIKGKNRRKSEPNRALNTSNESTSSAKKVKIDLRLNQSQEVHEHHAQIKSSPGIPFDANKKPSRSVIKANFMPSPINPFYRKSSRMNLHF